MINIEGRGNYRLAGKSISILVATLLGVGCLTTAAQESPFEKIIPEEVEVPISTSQAWRKVKLLHTLEEHKAAIDSLLFSPDSSILISGGGENDPQMRFWSVATGKKLDQIRAQRTAILALAISPDGKTLVSGGGDAGLNIWNWQIDKHYPADDKRSLRSLRQYQMTLQQHNNNVTSLAIAPDSEVLVSGSLDGIKVWNLSYQPQRPIYTLAGTGNPTSVMAIHPNSYILASSGEQGKVKFWNLKKGTFVNEFEPHQQEVSGLAFTIDGERIITASADSTIKIWDLATGQLLQTLTGHKGQIRAIALHPQGEILASGGDDGIILWNLATGKLLTQLKEHQNWIQSLAFSPDGRFLASGGFDFTVKIWGNAF